MIGSFRWNLTAACIGFLGTFYLSYSTNVLMTSLIRSLYSSLFLFVLAYLFRWLLGELVRAGTGEKDAGIQPDSSESGKGRNIDLATPADDGLPPVQAFEPLQPPKLSTNIAKDPQELAEALRRMNQE